MTLEATSTVRANSIQRYFRLVTDGARYELTRDGDDAWWSFRAADRDSTPSRQDGEFAMAVSVQYSRLWTEPEFAPSEVFFRHASPADTSELERFFKAPLSFESGQCALRFDSAVLEAPLKTADDKLAGLLERYAVDALASLPSVGRHADRVRGVLVKGVTTGATSLQSVAKHLAFSPRTLQRHLREEGTSHKALLDDVRRELATRYLTNEHLAASEVAYMLGFSETAPFFRAFKRWTGQTPGAFRQR